ncbi:phosphoribosylanthranilate isomerase [Roseivirga sp.]|uniref:phosphoribosylanthranilate isomerase n=1 Tax=Roseivirga sp. TaxID=1964215 RepID=UPI002B2690E5|nr:phosphoribosylanthranilate isomerase [Roseivirga sp.]
MALKTFVKVSGINNLSDARYCAGMEVDQLGFEVEETASNYTDIHKFKEISDWLSGVEYVGEITSTGTAIKTLIEGYQLDAIQIENIGQISEALETGLPVSFLAHDIDSVRSAWEASQNQLAYVLLDASEIEESALMALAKDIPVVLASGFDAETVTELAKSDLKGISIQGGNEIRPGYKDFDEMADILEALEIDDLADE